MLGRLRIRTKLAVLVAVPLIALVAAGVLGWTTLQDTKVLGPRYNSIKTSQQLLADVNPPSENLVESYLVAYKMVSASEAQREALSERFDGLRKTFEDGHAYWDGVLTAPEDAPLRDALLSDAYNSGHEFYSIATDQFAAALTRGDTIAARRLLETTMSAAYQRHETAINQTVALAQQRGQRIEKAADSFVSRRAVTLISLLGGILALAMLLGIFVARAITRSIERIRDRANEVATEELPALVARIDTLSDNDELPQLPAITVESQDELADLAEAFTTLQDTAVRLAAEQTVVRRNVSEVFVSLGRRNQGLLTRQLAFITDLEREQTDDQVLTDLFRLDHLATRMRRNAESLLVLAGAEQSRKVTSPMPIGDVVRAALSEIEDYSRIDFGDIEPAELKGNVATDTAHMLAELLENAASFSPPDSRVEVIGRVTHDGYLLSIVDHGIGMDSDTMLEANRRIAQVARFDRAPTKVLGLYVVGRLAQRHGFGVHLVDTPGRGITAKVVAPSRLLDNPSVLEPPSQFVGSAEATFATPVEAFVETPVEAFVETPVETFVEEPAQAFVEAPVETPIEDPVEAPVEALVEPYEAPVEAIEEPVEPYEAPVEAIDEPVQAIDEPVQAIVAEPVDELVAETLVDEPIEQRPPARMRRRRGWRRAETRAEEPAEQSVDALAGDPVEVEVPVAYESPVVEPFDALVEPYEPIDEPVAVVDEPASALEHAAYEAAAAFTDVYEALRETRDPVVDEPVAYEPTPVEDPVAYEPTPVEEPVAYEPTPVEEPVAYEPTPVEEPVAYEPTPVDEPVAPEPAASEPSFALSALDVYSFGPQTAPAPPVAPQTDDIEPEAEPASDDDWWPRSWERAPEPAHAEMPPAVGPVEEPHDVEPAYAFDDHNYAAEDPQRAEAHAEPHEPAIVTAVLGAPVEETTEAPTLLPKRVRGAHLPDTGPASRPTETRQRSADDVRSSLNRFRAGVNRGRSNEPRDDEASIDREDS